MTFRYDLPEEGFPACAAAVWQVRTERRGGRVDRLPQEFELEASP